jgi:hypothetical protein
VVESYKKLAKAIKMFAFFDVSVASRILPACVLRAVAVHLIEIANSLLI